MKFRAIALLGLVGLVTLLYGQSVFPLVALWADPERFYTQGFPLFALAVVLLIRGVLRTAANASFRPVPTAYAGALVLSLAWLLLTRSGIDTAAELLLPGILWTSILAAFGWDMARTCSFPLSLLLLAMPAWDYLAPGLQRTTALVVGQALNLVHVPVHIQGDYVQIPAATFEIAGGCSGIHYLLVAIAVAAIYGEVCEQPMRKRLQLTAIATALALVTNWVRVFIIILAGHVSSMQSYLVTVDHYWFGWILFGLTLTAFFWIAAKISVPTAASPHSVRQAEGPADSKVTSPRLTASVTAVLVVAIGPAWGAIRALQSPTLVSTILPAADSYWSGPLPPTMDWRPIYPGADAQSLALYKHGDTSLQIYVARFATQSRGKKLAGYGVSRLASTDLVVSERPSVAAGRPIVEVLLVDRDSSEELLWYWYVVGERTFRTGAAAQLWYGLTSLFTPSHADVFLLRARCGSGCDRTRDQLRSFVGLSGLSIAASGEHG